METKKCRLCLETKPIADFHKKKSASDGRQSQCKTCNNRTATEWRERNQEKYDAIYRKHYGDGMRQRARRYGIEVDILRTMFLESDGVCESCGVRQETLYDLQVDHDHKCCPGQKSCGKCVRGLICYGCNNGIARFLDDVAKMRLAIQYLERWDSREAQENQDC